MRNNDQLASDENLYIQSSASIRFEFPFSHPIRSAMLMLPWATNGGSNYLDVLFISTSAVCVTGSCHGWHLVVLYNNSDRWSFSAHSNRGLGILTFISYFSYFFKRNASYKSQEMMGAMNNVENPRTFSRPCRKHSHCDIQYWIGWRHPHFFCSISENLIPNVFDRIGFSIFHAVSDSAMPAFPWWRTVCMKSLIDIITFSNFPLQPWSSSADWDFRSLSTSEILLLQDLQFHP